MSENPSILVVDDERDLVELMTVNLEAAGYRVLPAHSGDEALAKASEHLPNLIILDLMMPGLSGIEVARRLRANPRTTGVPIIMLTARAAEADQIVGLSVGADDYITKPFSPRELLSRINAVLRRAAPPSDEPLVAGDLRLDPVSHRVFVGVQEINLGPTEYRLLKFLMENADRVYSRTQLLDSVWGQNVYVEERTVDVHVRRLRKVLEEFHVDQYIQTVRGAGYRFSTR